LALRVIVHDVMLVPGSWRNSQQLFYVNRLQTKQQLKLMKTDAQWLDRFVKMEEKWKKDAEGWLEYMEVRDHSGSADGIRSKFRLMLLLFWLIPFWTRPSIQR
jgi:hypothetical protein